MTEIPSVSVVVPMYNSARFIGELLDSVLNQTLKNIEIIIVDDSSTDNSVEIVESYQEKFGDRLTIMKNSVRNEGAGAKRNRGLEMSRGKYIFFMDSDDVLMKTGLEEMYNIAEEFQADVVYCERHYISTGIGEEFIKNARISDFRTQLDNFVEKPTLYEYDLKKRIEDWFTGKFYYTVAPWQRLSLRNFLVDNEIKFQPLSHQNDNIQAIESLLSAKRLVRTSKPFYLRRLREDSISATTKNLHQVVMRFIERTIRDTDVIYNFMSKIDFFKENPDQKYLVMNCLAISDIKVIRSYYPDVPSHIIFDIIKKDFSDYMGENSALIAYLLSNTYTLNGMYYDAKKKLIALEEKLEK